MYDVTIQSREYLERKHVEMRDLLIRIYEAGGPLPPGVPEKIKNAVGAPNGHFCTRLKACVEAGRCTRETVCND